MADTQINVGMNVDGVITGTDKAKRKIGELGGAAREAGRGTGAIGDGMAATSQKVESATRNMIASIQRQTAALESGSKASREYQESLARSRGVDTAALRPYLDQLDAVREKQERAAQASELMKSAGEAAGLAFAAAAAGLAASVKSVIDTADSFSKMSAKTGVAVEALRELNYAASMSDVSTEALGVNMQKLTLNMSKAAGGAKEQSEVFKAMGVSVKDASGQLKGSGDFLQELAGKFANYADGPEKAALAMQIFGESGAAMIPLLNSGAQGLKDMAQEANELGTVFGGDMAKQAEAFNDSLTRIQTLTQSGAITIANELLPTLNLLTNTFLESAKQGKGFGSDLATGVRVAMEAIVILYSDVEFVLKAMGREIGAVAAQLAALGRLDFKGFTAISDAVKEDGKRAREELDKFQKDVLNARFTTSQAGAGRGTAADPRVLGDIPSMQTVAPVVQKAAEGARKALKEMGDEFASQRAAAADWAKTMGDFAKIQRDVEAASDGLSKAQARLMEYLGSTAYTDASDEMRELALQSAYAAIASEQLADAKKAEAKALDDSIKAYADLVEAQQGVAQTAAQNLQAQLDQNAAIGLTAAELAALEVAKLNDIAASKEQRASALDIIDTSGQLGNAYRAEAKALRDLASAKAAGAAKQAVADRAKDAADEWKRTSDKIEQSLTDALMRGFESGKGFAETLRDTVSNMFKTLVLRPIVSAVVSPVAGAITGSLGLAGAANAATTGANAMSGMGVLGGSLGALGTGLGAGAGMIAGGGVGGWLSASTSLIGTGTAAGAMAGIGALAGPIGAALAVASLLKGLDDSGTMHTGGLGSYSAARGSSTGDAVKAQGLGFDLSSNDYNAATAQASVAIAQAVAGMLDSTAATFGQKAGYFAATAWADDTSDDGGWGALMVKLGDQVLLDWKNGTDKWPGREFSDGEAGAKEYAAAVATDVRDYLITQTPAWADTMLTALGDAPSLEQLAATVAQINQVQTALEGMGQASAAFAGLTEAATSALVASLGGAEASVASLSAYYGNFYSESERAAITTANLTGQLGELGQAMPTSREAFRGLVDAAIAAGDTTLAAGLINLQDEFAALVPAANNAASAVSGVLPGLQNTAKTLQREIIELQGGDLRAFDTQGFTADEVAAYDLNTSLTALRDGLKASKTATDTLAATQQQAADTAQQAATDTLGAWKDTQRSMAQGWLDSAKTLQDARYESAQRELDSARQAATAIAAARTSAAQASIDAVSDIASALTNAREALTGAASQPLTKTSYGAARGLIDQAAAAGDLNQAGLEDALKVVSGNTQSLFGRFEDWAMAQAAAAEPVAKLDAQAQGQMAAAQAIIATMKAQEEEAKLRYDESKRTLGDQHNAMMDSLQMQYDAQIAQIEATQSVAAAMGPFLSAITSSASGGGGSGQTASQQAASYAQLTSAISGLANQLGITYGQAEVMMQTGQAPSGQAPSGVGNSSYIGQGINATAPIGSAQDLANKAAYDAGQKFETTYNPNGGYDLGVTLQFYKDMYPVGSFGSNYSVSGFQSYLNAVGYNARGAEATELLKIWGKAVGLPSYAVGTPYVPEDGPAYLHKGEMVVPAAYNPNATGYSQASSNAEVVAELRAMRQSLAAIQSAANATAGHTAGTDRKLARVIKADAITTEASV